MRSVLAVVLLAYGGLSSPHAPDVDAWFASLTTADLQPFVDDFTSWQAAEADGASVTFGKAAPVLGYDLPTYDVHTHTLSRPARLDDALVPSGEYCARGLVDGVPSDFTVCAEPDGTGYRPFGADEVRFLDSYSDADLPAAGVTYPGHHFIGVVDGSVVPLDQTAASWLGAPSLDGTTFVTLAAKRTAEADPALLGEGPPLTAPDPSGTDWVGPAVFVALVAALAVGASRWRRRKAA